MWSIVVNESMNSSTYTGHCLLPKVTSFCQHPVFRIRCVYSWSRITIFPSRILDPGSKRSRIRIRIKNLSILTQKIVSKLLEIWSRMFILDPGSRFFFHPRSRIRITIPDPRVNKAPDPWSGSATLPATFQIVEVIIAQLGGKISRSD